MSLIMTIILQLFLSQLLTLSAISITILTVWLVSLILLSSSRYSCNRGIATSIRCIYSLCLTLPSSASLLKSHHKEDPLFPLLLLSLAISKETSCRLRSSWWITQLKEQDLPMDLRFSCYLLEDIEINKVVMLKATIVHLSWRASLTLKISFSSQWLDK